MWGPDQWMHLIALLLAIGASILAFGKFMQRVDAPQTKQQGAWDHDALEALIRALALRVTALESRFDRGNSEISKLSSIVQGWEERARGIFPDKGVYSAEMRAAEHERRQLRDELNRLRSKINNVS